MAVTKTNSKNPNIRNIATFDNGNTVFSYKISMPMDVLVCQKEDGTLFYSRTSRSYKKADGTIEYKQCYFPADNDAVMKAIAEAKDAGTITSIGKEAEGKLGYIKVNTEWWVDLTLSKSGKVLMPEKVVKNPKDPEKVTRCVFWIEDEPKAEIEKAIKDELTA